jgi:hypothetical protein
MIYTSSWSFALEKCCSGFSAFHKFIKTALVSYQCYFITNPTILLWHALIPPGFALPFLLPFWNNPLLLGQNIVLSYKTFPIQKMPSFLQLSHTSLSPTVFHQL